MGMASIKFNNIAAVVQCEPSLTVLTSAWRTLPVDIIFSRYVTAVGVAVMYY